jgi:hypothetical protein
VPHPRILIVVLGVSLLLCLPVKCEAGQPVRKAVARAAKMSRSSFAALSKVARAVLRYPMAQGGLRWPLACGK